MKKAHRVRSPAFQAYPKEWLSSEHITMMTPAQEGGYWRLLCYAWLDPECSLPDDDDVLARLSRLGDEWSKGGYNLVKQRFVPHPTIPGRIVNLRQLEEREKQRIWREKSSKGGRKSAVRRWGKDSLDKGKGGYKMVTDCLPPNCNQRGNQSVTLQSPVSSLHKGGTGPPSMSEKILYQNELKRVESRIGSVRAGGTTTAQGTTYTEAQRAELKGLRERQKELINLLGFKA